MPAWSPDGSFLVASTGSDLELVRTDGSRARLLGLDATEPAFASWANG